MPQFVYNELGMLVKKQDNDHLKDALSYVKHPPHYNKGKIEVIEYLKETLSPEEFKGFIKGNVVKYLAREGHKNGLEDVLKAQFYLDYYVNLVGGGK